MQEIAPRETTAPARGRVDGGHLALHAAVVVDEPGRPLESATQAVMERRFGFDFSRIRVHTDARAAESATSVNAVAYTVGQDVVFAPGAYSPERPEGLRLLAHELAHVVQSAPSRAGTGAVEPDARRAADAVAWTSDPVRPVASAPFGTVLRQEAAEAALNPATVRSTHPFDRPRLLTEELQRPEPLVTLPPVLPPLRLERFTDPPVERAVDRLLLALDRLRGTPDIGRAWPRVLEQVRRPGSRPPRNAPAELYEPDLVAALDALTPGGHETDEGRARAGTRAQGRGAAAGVHGTARRHRQAARQRSGERRRPRDGVPGASQRGDAQGRRGGAGLPRCAFGAARVLRGPRGRDGDGDRPDELLLRERDRPGRFPRPQGRGPRVDEGPSRLGGEPTGQGRADRRRQGGQLRRRPEHPAQRQQLPEVLVLPFGERRSGLKM